MVAKVVGVARKRARKLLHDVGALDTDGNAQAVHDFIEGCVEVAMLASNATMGDPEVSVVVHEGTAYLSIVAHGQRGGQQVNIPLEHARKACEMFDEKNPLT